jgi:hypothetical protein
MADAPDLENHSNQLGPLRKGLSCKGFLFPASGMKKTLLACFGPVFKRAGYKKGYKGQSPISGLVLRGGIEKQLIS